MTKRKVKRKTIRVEQEKLAPISASGEVRLQEGWNDLSAKDQQFIMAYMTTGDHVSACRQMQYPNPASAGCKFMKRPAVRKYLSWWRDRVFETNEIDAFELLRQINQTIRSDRQEFVDQDTGLLISDLRKLSPEAGQQIEGVEQEVMELFNPDGEVVGRKIKMKYKWVSKAAAWKLAAEIAGLVDRKEAKENLKTINWDEMYGKPKDLDDSDDIEKRIAAISKLPTTTKRKTKKVLK